MASHDKTLIAIEEYHKRHRPEGAPPFEIHDPFDLFPGAGLPRFPGIKGWNRNEYWPHADRRGVYLVFDDDLVLIYVGKASMNSTIGARLFSHFGSGEVCNPGPNWTTKPRYVVTVAMPKEQSFEAPALEEYLIGKLHPVDNTTGRYRE